MTWIITLWRGLRAHDDPELGQSGLVLTEYGHELMLQLTTLQEARDDHH